MGLHSLSKMSRFSFLETFLNTSSFVENQGKIGRDREHLTVIGATSGDTGSAAIYGLRGRKTYLSSLCIPHGKGQRSSGSTNDNRPGRQCSQLSCRRDIR